MSEAKPKRQFWQIHLSTLAVVCSLSGMLLGLNLRGPHIKADYTTTGGTRVVVVQGEGWPVPRINVSYGGLEPEEALVRYKSGRIWFRSDYVIGTSFWRLFFPDSSTSTPDNCVVAAIAVLGTTVLLERRIRRRDARKT